MEILLFLGYEGLVAVVPFVLLLSALDRGWRRKGFGLSRRDWGLAAVFVLYAAGALHFTGAGTVYDLLRVGWEPRPEQANLIPFSRQIDPAGYLLNILLFAPLGILTPLLWEKGRRACSVAGLGAAVSLLVELSQLLDNRSSDVDDLIVNTAGALLGFGGYKLWVRRAGEPGRKTPVSLLPLCILVPFVGRFFLFNEMGLARLLYGF